MKRPFKTYAEMDEEERQTLQKQLDAAGIPRLVRRGRIKRLNKKKDQKRRLLYLEAKRWVWKQLGNKCENCGESNESTFDIHHEYESPKSNQARHREILKWYEDRCIPEGIHLFCANCHRKLKHPIERN